MSALPYPSTFVPLVGGRFGTDSVSACRAVPIPLPTLVVPLVTRNVIKHITLLYTIAHEFWKDIDDDLDPLQRLLWKLWRVFLDVTPQWMDAVVEAAWDAFCKIPSGVWKTMPYTILTIAQTSVLLPLALNKVENFFRWAAHSDAKLV